MIKHINHQNVSTTPFVAAKARALYNIQNDDSLITEVSVYPNNTQISLDYVDYNNGNPATNRDCNIALEQQGFDSVGYEEGINGSGTFNSASDARNTDGTYKNLVHRQIKNAFYNSYRNPTEIFGVEHIDFPLSKTLRNLSDSFKMFTIPRLIFGEKIQPRSVHFYDTLMDDNVEIFDDGYQNLIAGYNLFSKVQEVRTFPSGAGYQNIIFPGSASNECITFDTLFFITQPQDIYVDLGATVFFSVTAVGNAPIYYQWQTGSTNMVDDTRVTGSNTSYITINSASFSDSGSYRILVWNNSRGITSSYANLHINSYPPIISNPADMAVDIGGTFLFDVNIIGGWFPMYYQWESGSTNLLDDTRITGSNTASLTVNNIMLSDSGSYRIMVSNFFGGVTSSYANGHVNLYAPLIVSNPQDQTAYEGFSASFAITASGTLPLMYQWISGSTNLIDDSRITGSSFTGSLSSSLRINDVMMADSGTYKVLVSNFVGSVYSNTATLTVLSNNISIFVHDSASVSQMTVFGSVDQDPIVEFTPTVTTGLTASLGITDVILPTGGSDSGSIDSGFYSGSLITVIVSIGGNDSGSLDSGFYSGSIFTVIISAGGNDSGSMDSGFYSGSIATVVVTTNQTDAAAIITGLVSGSCA